MLSLPKHIANIINKAAVRAIPTLAERFKVDPEKKEAWDYSSPTAIKIFNMSKKQGSFGFASCQDLAKAIADNIHEVENDAIEKIELK